ncbi:MAG: hypothetical protein JWM31_2851 [Solirubrobacterales bacterium]|nr:hypothetical protein [Solirubrobacterales bacterium]
MSPALLAAFKGHEVGEPRNETTISTARTQPVVATVCKWWGHYGLPLALIGGGTDAGTAYTELADLLLHGLSARR